MSFLDILNLSIEEAEEPPATMLNALDLAIALAQEFPCEIISVDSTLVYQGLDIGSAKPGVDIRNQIPHHLIDIVNPGAQVIEALTNLTLPSGVNIDVKMM